MKLRCTIPVISLVLMLLMFVSCQTDALKLDELSNEEETTQPEYTDPVEPIWSQERESSIDHDILMYENITREKMLRIDIHNPDNEKYGAQYVDWGIFHYMGGAEYYGLNLIKDEFYLIGYEYVETIDSNRMAQVVVAAGYPLATARVEDHCTDFSKYGLDYASPEEATSVTLTLLDGSNYTYYVGDQVPSGDGYYVRYMNEDTPIGGGEAVVRDSVYVISSLYLDSAILQTPQILVEPYMTMPIVTTNQLYDNFAIWRKEDRYFSPKLDAEGNQQYNENGEAIRVWDPMVLLRPLSDLEDPFSVFAGLSFYEAVVPHGYYGSSGFEQILSIFSDFKGEEVVELGQKIVDENGKINYEISDEVFERYGLKDYYYQLQFTFDDIPNVIYVSEKQDDGYYYVYSLNLNVIVKATEEQLYFLNWKVEDFIDRRVFNAYIDDCDTITLEGNYVDTGYFDPERTGAQSVDVTFKLRGTGSDLIVTDKDNDVIDTDNFRQFYRSLLMQDFGKICFEEKIPDEVYDAINGPMIAKLTVKTRDQTIYKTDAEGNPTADVDYKLKSISKVIQFYRTDDGKVYYTVVNIDENGYGKRVDDVYLLDTNIDIILSAALAVEDGYEIDLTPYLEY